MMYLGCDPGRQGAFALFDKTEMTVQTFDMPDTLSGVHRLLSEFPPLRACIIEKPFYPRMVGTANVAVMAENYGALKSSLLWLDIPCFEVRPAEWKKGLNLGPSKSDSRNKASQIFPGNADQWHMKKHDGRAEAALIAWFGQGKAK
jgi:crossover junction endodeoxyribonuclease RuvC